MELLLRWWIGLGSALGIVLFLLVLTVGRGLGSAYQSGARGERLEAVVLTVMIPALLVMMLVGALRPDWRPLLHVTSAMALVGAGGCVMLLRTNPGEAAMYLSLLGSWLGLYAMRMTA
jgi:hypothetical protein